MEGREGQGGQEPTPWAEVVGLETQGVGPEREDRGHTTGGHQPPFQGLAYEQSQIKLDKGSRYLKVRAFWGS